MCNPSRHFKGREAWTDVVLLVYQMGLYDEKSIIPIQASLPSLVLHKAIQFIARNNLFFQQSQTEQRFFFFKCFSCIHAISVFIFPFSHPSVSLSLHISPISLLFPLYPLSLCSWRLANVALANIQRARQAIPFYPPGLYWLSYSVCIGNECSADAGKPHASDWYSIYMSLQDMLVWFYGFTLAFALPCSSSSNSNY